jgi:hypothetical protein
MGSQGIKFDCEKIKPQQNSTISLNELFCQR